MKKYIMVDEADDVITVLQDIRQHTEIVLEDKSVIKAAEDIPCFHKMAIRNIPKGNVVLRYGAPIGYATQPISAGQWVHVHNLDALKLM